MHKRLFGILGSVAIIVAACGGATTSSAPAASGASTPPAASGSAAAPSSSASGDQTLNFAIDADVSGGLTNAADNVPTAQAIQFLYDALYIFDASLTPQPAIAKSLASISTDGKVWTVELRDDVKFSDGTPLTADDVVQTYALAQSVNCTYSPSLCLNSFLASVEKVDATHVKFTLKQALSTFATIYLPGIFIENKKAVDASYARYLEATKAVTAAELKTFTDKVAAEEKTPTGAPAEGSTDKTVNYAQFQAEAEALLTKAGQPLPDKALFPNADGTTDLNAYTKAIIDALRTIETTATANATDALAAAYKYLDIQLNPVGLGTGPFKFVTYKTGESLEYANNPDYFKGASAISKVFVPIIKDDIAGGQALAAGQVDWKYSMVGGTYNSIKDNTDLQFDTYPDFGFFSLYFNQRPGTLFSDKNLRQGLDYCFDKEATAKAATEDNGVAIYSEIPPASWAYPTTGLNTYPMDQAKAKSLIESSGWTLGTDGIYVNKDGKRLSTTVAVRAGRPDRSKWMQLVGDQVKACGIELKYKEVDFGALLNMLTTFPHINAADPTSGKPFDAYFGGFSTGYDPDPFTLYDSSQCSTKEQPDTNNFICYKNPEVDKLIAKGLTTFDQAARATIYQQYAVIQSNDLPVIYAWADIAHQGLRKTVSTTASGGLQLDTPQFAWQLEKLTNVKQ